MCALCEDLEQRFEIRNPEQYRETARRILERVRQSELSVESAEECSLEELVACTVWPADVIVHRVACMRCGAEFELSADTYHGGSRWSGAVRSSASNV